jgi:hypothetical protein
MKTARWLQCNRHEAITAIQNSCRPEIAAYSKVSNNDINQAKLEALAYYEYRANVLRTQLYGYQQSSQINQHDGVTQSQKVEQSPTIPNSSVPSNGSSTNGSSTNGNLTNIPPKLNPLDDL